MNQYYYGYEEFLKDLKILFNRIKEYEPDILLSVARGGVCMGHFLAERLNNKRLYTINSIHYDDKKKLNTIKIFNIPDLSEAKKVLILDDIIDSGDTMIEILKILKEKYPYITFKIATIFFKKEAPIKADFTLKEAKEWIDFFWSVDLNN